MNDLDHRRQELLTTLREVQRVLTTAMCSPLALKGTGRIRHCYVAPGLAGEQLLSSMSLLPFERGDEAEDLTLWDIYALHDDDVMALCERLIAAGVVFFVR